ncbi:type II toxin-antitoxin system ParD family antitoxin [Patescibacteria group bacterium]|nr:type II toxin-antitoxin system ParD family antitoxin [Patescibacteria group bacterium]
MATINISIPEQLKSESETLVRSGYYASFSDLVRDSLRHLLEKSKFDLLANQAKKELKKGKATVLDSNKAIDEFLGNL